MSDWRELTPEELALIRSCGPDERCLLYGNVFVKLPTKRIEQIMEHAFRAAYADAAKELGEDVEAFDVGEMELGATHMRVTVTGASGKQAFAVAMIPDPRAH